MKKKLTLIVYIVIIIIGQVLKQKKLCILAEPWEDLQSWFGVVLIISKNKNWLLFQEV